MARKPRIHYPGAVYHVMLRGNAGQDIFFNGVDCSHFYLLIQKGIKRFGHRTHAFCLMANHIHLVIQVADIPLSSIMHNLSFRYTRYINTRRKCTGHLFQGRYKAILLDADTYLLELVRYIHLNPVRSGIVRKPEEYRWSSHRAYLGQENLPWLFTEWVLSCFSNQADQARHLYDKFVAEGTTEKFRPEFYRGMRESRILGDDTFAEEALQRANEKMKRKVTIDGIIEHVCRMYKINPGELGEAGKQRVLSEARAMAAWLVRESDGISLTELGKYVNRELSSLSIAANRLQERARADHSLAQRMERVKERLS